MVSFISKIVLGKVHLIWQGGGMKILRGGLPKFLDTRKGSSEKIRGGGAPKICILLTQKEGGGLLKNWTASEGGC